jgi:hypothetical protein
MDHGLTKVACSDEVPLCRPRFWDRRLRRNKACGNAFSTSVSPPSSSYSSKSINLFSAIHTRFRKNAHAGAAPSNCTVVLLPESFPSQVFSSSLHCNRRHVFLLGRDD